MTAFTRLVGRGSPEVSAGTWDGLELVESTEVAPEVNLDYAATTPALQATLDAVAAFLPHYGSVHRGGGRRSAFSTDAYESARRTVAGFVGCPAGSSVVFVRNTTEAANLLAAALPSGSRVLCSPFEHHANLLPWRIHRVEHLPFTGSAGEFATVVDAALAEAVAAGDPFDLLAVSAASNVTGEVTPLPDLASTAHRHGARIFVDAAQLAPHRPIDIDASGVDFLAFSGHKLYAPFGAGALIVRDEALSEGLPLLRGGGAVKLVSLDDVAWEDSPRRYEAGTPNTIGAIALAAACEALADFGVARIRDEEERLAHRLWEGIGRIQGVELLRMWTEAPDRVGVATFTIPGHDPRSVADALAARFGIAVRSGAFCAHPLVAHLLAVPQAEVDSLFERLDEEGSIRIPGALRASVGIGVIDDHVDRFLDAVESIASGR